VVDPMVANSILNNLRSYLGKLQILAAVPKQEFLMDFTKVESAKHLLQVSIESCLDLAQHIVADEGYRTPNSYYDTFVVLHEVGILPDDLMPTLRQMVGFRNRAVHLYWEIDDATVYRILQQNLGDFDVYVGYILGFIQSRKDEE
jgi:uncharacterized protein YutE (UPF0331/DUF86 family)